MRKMHIGDILMVQHKTTEFHSITLVRVTLAILVY